MLSVTCNAKLTLCFFQIVHALLQALGPIRDNDAEGGFYLGFVKYAIAWACDRRWELIAMAGLDVARYVASVLGYLFSFIC